MPRPTRTRSVKDPAMSTRRSLVTRAAAVMVAALAVAVLGACGGDAKLQSAELLRASVTSLQATQVTVTFLVSGDPNCGQYEGADVRDEPSTVTVLVTLRTTARDCPDDGVETERTLRLTHPLGDRRLVDRSTGRAIDVAVVP
jgi:hypothetical protein